MPPMIAMPEPTTTLRKGVTSIVDSFTRLIRRPLIEVAENEDLFTALWNAPRVVVAHRGGSDPVFFYGNRAALELFEMDFAAFTQMPSRFSAEAEERIERERLLATVMRQGYIDNYAGIRVSRSGRRFRIEQAVVWNLVEADESVCGQAATFNHWTPL